MNRKIYVSLKDMLPISSIDVLAEFNGTLDDVAIELKSPDPDVVSIEMYMTPVVTVTIPHVCFHKVIIVEGTDAVFSCLEGGKIMKSLMNYCETMKIQYRLGEKA